MKKSQPGLLKSNSAVERLGTVGVFMIALFSPCCFPLFAFALSAMGLGSFELFGGWTMWLFQAMAGISVLGFYLTFRKSGFIKPLIISILSATLILLGYHFVGSDNWIIWLYSGMFGLLVATDLNYWYNKKIPFATPVAFSMAKKWS